ncbi:hypothetical protein [Nocardiopsis baichengensis]|uniref:hypothetical protein n=1 Tax=Nocardiopsis baichengensis TaxID=280240 RepID=UPI001268A852|nr:hypothetical protein [Nocardiopsis baichengensis]
MGHFEYKDDADLGKLTSTQESILDLVSRITGKSGDLEALFNDASKEFHELIAEPIRSAADDNASAWQSALTACYFAWGQLQQWSVAVETYRSKIDDINSRWDEAEAMSTPGSTVDPTQDPTMRGRKETNPKAAAGQHTMRPANSSISP